MADICQIICYVFFTHLGNIVYYAKNLLMAISRFLGLNLNLNLNLNLKTISLRGGKRCLVKERNNFSLIEKTPLLNKKFSREDLPLLLALDECRNSNSFNSVTEKKKAIKVLLAEIAIFENKTNLLIKENKDLAIYHSGLRGFYERYFAAATQFEHDNDPLWNSIVADYKKKIRANYNELEAYYYYKKFLEFYKNAFEKELKPLERNHYAEVKNKMKNFSLILFTTFTLKKFEWNKKNLIIFLRILSLALSVLL